MEPPKDVKPPKDGDLDDLEPRFEDAPAEPAWETKGQFTSPQRDAQGLEPTAPLRPTAPPLQSSADATQPEGYAPPFEWDISPTLLRLAPQRRPPTGQPGQGVACATCPISIWFVAPSMVRCHCPPLMVVTWETGQPQMEISLCDARERAIELALQQQQEPPEG